MVLMAGLLCGPVAAQDLPALHDVAGVAANDQLNIRAEPSASAAILGSFPPGTDAVEVTALSADGRWGRVNLEEGAGWVAMRYMARQSGPGWADLAQPLACFGTEPFWSLNFSPAEADLRFNRMGEEPLDLRAGWAAPVSGRRGMVGLALTGAAETGFLTLTGQDCSDGMSDRGYGIGIALFLNGSGASTAEAAGWSGCCSLDR
ncbi:MAG: SH3 domain-containing protein [Pseudorhodobacter sp.]